jgi:anaerobic ribonucleoside-triphosphate reductase
MTVKTDGDFVDLKYDFEPDVPFDRIRRITGYLVGTLDRFNNGKRAEEHDRVKHTI